VINTEEKWGFQVGDEVVKDDKSGTAGTVMRLDASGLWVTAVDSAMLPNEWLVSSPGKLILLARAGWPFRVGDLVEAMTNRGLAKGKIIVINPGVIQDQYLVSLDSDYVGGDAQNYWRHSWFPARYKKVTYNRRWLSISNLRPMTRKEGERMGKTAGVQTLSGGMVALEQEGDLAGFRVGDVITVDQDSGWRDQYVEVVGFNKVNDQLWGRVVGQVGAAWTPKKVKIILLERPGLPCKVGDRVRTTSLTGDNLGEVAVLNPQSDRVLLKLSTNSSHDATGESFWNEPWYPDKHKTGSKCYAWVSYSSLEIVEARPSYLVGKGEPVVETGTAGDLDLKRASYIKLCLSANVRTELAALQSKITTINQQLEKLRYEIFKLLRQRFDIERELAIQVEWQKKLVEKHSASFNELLQVEGLKDVAIESDKIVVWTEPLNCLNPLTGQHYKLGQFKIFIYADGSNGGIKFFNISGQVSIDGRLMHAPQLMTDGAPRWQLQDAAIELIAANEYSTLINLALQFLQQLEPDEFINRCLASWPLAEEPVKTDEPVIKEKEPIVDDK